MLQQRAERSAEHSIGPAEAVLRLLARAIAALPRAPQRWLGRLLGALGLRLARRRRRIAARNLELCFPDLDGIARERLLRRNFAAAGHAIVETASAWSRPPESFVGRLDVIGEAHLRRALAAPEGTLLLGCHLLTLEIGGALLGTLCEVDAVQRSGRGSTLDALRDAGRRRHFDALIDRDDVRGLLRRLRAGRCVWYAFDQDPGPGRGVLVPFFGISTATTDAAPRIAALAGARLLFVDHWRDVRAERWTLRFTPVDAALPSGDARADTARLLGLVEAAVRDHPEQYLWMHRRFKTRPAGEPSPYD